MSALTVSQAEWDQWKTERIERARASRERDAWMTAGPKGTDHLLARIEELEDRLYVTQVVLESCAQLLTAKCEQIRAFDRMLNEMVQESVAKRERPVLAVAA
jgi:hypothetical protein